MLEIKKMKESVIQKAILDYLELLSRTKPIYYFRAGAGAVRMSNGRYFKTGRPGCPDIIVCDRGSFKGIEVKTKTGRQSQAQKQAEKDINAAYGSYHIVRSVADAKRIFEN